MITFTEKFADIPSGIYAVTNPKSGLKWEIKVDRLPGDHAQHPGMLFLQERKAGTRQWYDTSSKRRTAGFLSNIRKQIKANDE